MLDSFFSGPLWLSLVMVALLISLIVFSVRPGNAFVGASGILFVTGSIDESSFLAGFVNTALITLILLLLCSIALEKTIFIKLLGSRIFRGEKHLKLAKMTLFASLASAIANNTAVVSVMMSCIKQQRHIAPSQFLLPLSYASIVGGTLTLVGTSTNLLVSGFVESYGFPPLGLFSTTPVAIWVVLSCFIMIVLTTNNLLPHKASSQPTSNEYLIEAKVAKNSLLINKSVINNGFRQLKSLFLVEIVREGSLISPVLPEDIIKEGDRLLFAGAIEELSLLKVFHGLEVLDEPIVELNNNVVEVVIASGANISSKTIKETNFRSLFNASVIGVRRGAQKLSGGLGNIRLQVGDSLLLAVGEDFKTRQNLHRNFILMDSDSIKTEQLSFGPSLAILLAFITVLGCAAAAVLPLLKGLLILLVIFLVTRVLGLSELRRRIPFEILIVIGCALAIGQAMLDTGLAAIIGSIITDISQDYGVIGSFVTLYLITWILTELITNTAAAALVFPIAITLSEYYGVSYLPFVIAVAFAASASFLSPFGYQTNLMVYSVGKYKVIDYFKFGLPISITYSATALYLIPKVYPF